MNTKKILISGLMAIAVLQTGNADPVRMETGFNTSTSLNDWSFGNGGVDWFSQSGNGEVRLLSTDDQWKSLSRSDLALDSGYTLSFKAKVTNYGSNPPLFVRVRDGAYKFEMKFLSTGIEVRTSTGWAQVTSTALPSGTYGSYVLVTDEGYGGLFYDGLLITSFDLLPDSSSDVLQFLSKGSATAPSGCRITSVTLSGTSVVTGGLNSWKKNRVDQFATIFPDSPVNDTSSDWSSSVSEATDLSGSTWYTGLDESKVYHSVIKHTQNGGSSNYLAARSWELRVGKGGQIYSLIHNAAGETVPPQAPSGVSIPAGTLSTHHWNDEVWQPTALNTVLGSGGSGHVYQAGTYSDPAENNGDAFYSPLLVAGAQGDSTYITANWSMQPHVPTPYRSESIRYHKYRDVGSGIIEVTYLFHNFGETTLDRFSGPWGGVRRTTFDYEYMSDTNGNLNLLAHNAFAAGEAFGLEETSGWTMYADNTTSSNANAMGLVFGLDHSPFDADQYSRSIWRRGYAGGTTTQSGEADWRNYLVGSRKLLTSVEKGETLFIRYYLVMGSVSSVPSFVNAYNLTNAADYGKLTFSTTDTAKIDWYINALGLLTTTPQSGKEVWVSTYAAPVAGSKPLFYLRSKTSNRLYATTEPYLLSEVSPDQYYQRPYDGYTEYVGMLGYIIEE